MIVLNNEHDAQQASKALKALLNNTPILDVYYNKGAKYLMLKVELPEYVYLMNNQQIRKKIRWQEDEISAGDMLMVVRNNYYWLAEESKVGFIANGDIIEVLKVKERIERYGFNFARATIRMIDYHKEKELDVIRKKSNITNSIIFILTSFMQIQYIKFKS